MNRSEVIKWCKDFLPSWPELGNDLKKLARPMGWKWEETRLPYMTLPSLVLVNGMDNCVPVTEGYVFPLKIAPPIQPPIQPPGPIKAVYPNHVNDFLKSVKIAKESPVNDINCEVLMNQEKFDKIYNDYPPLRMSCNGSQTYSMIDGITIRVVNNDILVISKFINMYEPLFMMHCAALGVNAERVKETLIHQDD